MLNSLRQNKQRRHWAERIYAVLVAQAREPVFFERMGVPDSLDGRFDLVALHAWLVPDRLKGDAPLSQALIDAIFISFDEALRELGAGDVGMGRRGQKLAEAFYGRLKAYDEAVNETGPKAALRRNLYRGGPAPAAETGARYAWAAKARLQSWQGGDPKFGPLPDEE